MTEENKELIRNTTISLTAGVPYLGGVVSFFLDKKLPSQIQKQYDDFLKSLDDAVEELQIEINENIIQSHEFFSLFNKTVDHVICEYSEIKKGIYRNILLSALSNNDSFNYTDFFVFLTNKLTVDEIKWLAFTEEYKKQKGESLWRDVANNYQESDNSLVMHIQTKLVRYRLIKGDRISALGKMYIHNITSPIDLRESVIGENEIS